MIQMPAPREPRFFTLTFWLNRDYPVKHGYVRKTVEETAHLRLGPMVVGWQVEFHG
jgi:hypothetical protein